MGPAMYAPLKTNIPTTPRDPLKRFSESTTALATQMTQYTTIIQLDVIIQPSAHGFILRKPHAAARRHGHTRSTAAMIRAFSPGLLTPPRITPPTSVLLMWLMYPPSNNRP